MIKSIILCPISNTTKIQSIQSVLTLNPQQSPRDHRRQPPPANSPCSTQGLPRPNENWK